MSATAPTKTLDLLAPGTVINLNLVDFNRFTDPEEEAQFSNGFLAYVNFADNLGIFFSFPGFRSFRDYAQTCKADKDVYELWGNPDYFVPWSNVVQFTRVQTPEQYVTWLEAAEAALDAAEVAA
ncbi:hypothetical protein [Microbacterium oleivorans]|uniref:Uncharacterized protein n=1 Tax=Microbacterium oleivorans TaxID=273677 RepID=A0A4R5YEQ4_9MICO|nr:hypothetical protein [Microbacterium oleivorans]TDL43592.1 hypothetical protein E2R54_10285 [Microbacterium oleivorans]